MKHNFRGKLVDIRWLDNVLVKDKRGRLRRYAGSCQNQKAPFFIEFDKALPIKKVKGCTMGYVALHEALHVCFPDLREPVVTEVAEAMYLFLVRLGCLKEGQ